MSLKVVALLVIALAVALFAAQNPQSVDVHFLSWSATQISLAVVVLGSALAGALVVTILGGVRQLQLQLKIRRLQADLQQSQQENQRLEDELARVERRLGERQGTGNEAATAKVAASEESSRNKPQPDEGPHGD